MADRYTSWAKKWKYGQVHPVYVSLTEYWAVASYSGHLAVNNKGRVLKFTSYISAGRVANRANIIIRKEKANERV